MWKVGVQLDVVKALIVTAMGFFVGVGLAGGGGLSAEAFFSRYQDTESNKKVQAYWFETGIGYSDIEALISSFKCETSTALYRKACLNAVAQMLPDELDLSTGFFNDQNLIKNLKSDELTEKERLDLLLNAGQKINYDQILKAVYMGLPTEERSAYAASVINSFLSVYYDPHSYIIPTRYYDQVAMKSERSPYFVGVSYTKKDDGFYIEKVSLNSDAHRAGLRPQDKIISINKIAIADFKVSQVSALFRNQKTQKFNLKIQRGSEVKNMTLERSLRILSHAQFNLLGDESSIGLITISKFSEGICEEVKNILVKSRANENWSGVLLDLRDNPGGRLDEAACIAGLFLGPDRKAYYVEYNNDFQPNEVVLTSHDKVYYGPLVVLVNHRSASSSEFLAGALKDYQRALLIGRTTFGKGTFQEPEQWLQRKHIELFKTRGYYLLPSRNATQLVGVKPDIELPTEATEKREKDIFIRPVPAAAKKYAALRDEELDINPLQRDCISKIKNEVSRGKVKISPDDYFERDPVLNLSKNLIGCNKKGTSQMAQVAERNTDSKINF